MRAPLRLLPVVALATAWGWVGAPAAQANGYEGACTDGSGVTVVVDFQDLGQGALVRCADTFVKGDSGFDALKKAGFKVERVQTQLGALCTINDLPENQTCIDMPPASAFWGYWRATEGGEWTFSTVGANSQPEPGSFEGWSFSKDNENTSNPAPRIPASRDTLTSPTTAPASTTAAAPPTTVLASSSPSRSTSTKSSAKATRTTRSTVTATPPVSGGTVSAGASVSTTSSVVASTASASPSPSASPSASASASDSPSASSEATTTRAPVTEATIDDTSPGPDAQTVIGIALVGGVAAATGIVWWRQRGMRL